MSKYVAVTFIVEPDGEYYVSKCLELGTASSGLNEEEAFENLADATDVYLNTLEDLGECAAVFKEKGVKVHPFEPTYVEIRRAKFPIDSVIRPTIFKQYQDSDDRDWFIPTQGAKEQSQKGE